MDIIDYKKQRIVAILSTRLTYQQEMDLTAFLASDSETKATDIADYFNIESWRTKLEISNLLKA